MTDGVGLVARRGGEVLEIRPGDVVYIDPGEEHWHGATPDRFMPHIAMQEADEKRTGRDMAGACQRWRVPDLTEALRAPSRRYGLAMLVNETLQRTEVSRGTAPLNASDNRPRQPNERIARLGECLDLESDGLVQIDGNGEDLVPLFGVTWRRSVGQAPRPSVHCRRTGTRSPVWSGKRLEDEDM